MNLLRVNIVGRKLLLLDPRFKKLFEYTQYLVLSSLASLRNSELAVVTLILSNEHCAFNCLDAAGHRENSHVVDKYAENLLCHLVSVKC